MSKAGSLLPQLRLAAHAPELKERWGQRVPGDGRITSYCRDLSYLGQQRIKEFGLMEPRSAPRLNPSQALKNANGPDSTVLTCFSGFQQHFARPHHTLGCTQNKQDLAMTSQGTENQQQWKEPPLNPEPTARRPETTAELFVSPHMRHCTWNI